MKTLDINSIQENNEMWFEDLDTTCPFCHGEGELENGDYCEHCENGHFAIYWNTAFEVPYLRSNLDFERAHKKLFKENWLLFEYEGEMWIAAGSCGYDFSWVRQSAILYLCGDIPADYAHDLSRGGHVFVSDSRKRTLVRETRKALRWEIKRTYMDIADLGNLL